MITVSSSWAASILDFCVANGVSREEIFKKLDGENVLEPVEFSAANSSTRFDIEDVVRVWDVCASLSKNPFFGLSFGRYIKPKHLDVVGFMLMTSESLKVALDQLVQYQSIVSQGGLIGISQSKDCVDLWYQPQPLYTRFSHHQVDAILSGIVHYIQFLSGKEIYPVRAELSHRNVLQAPYQSLLGCKVFGDCPSNVLTYEKLTLENPCINANAEINKLMEGYAATKLLSSISSGSITAAVCSTIYNQFGKGDVNKLEVARALHMSPRTMQRRLSEQGTSFQALLEFTRKQVALAGLRSASSSVDDLAEYLGYADESSFYKAYKRWTGSSIKNDA